MCETVWTDDRVEQLTKLLADGLTSSRQIADEMGCFNDHSDGGCNAIIKKIERLNLPPLPPPETFWTADRIEQLQKLRADGLSSGKIANELGCSRNAIVGKLHRLKLPVPAKENPRPGPRRPRPGKIASQLLLIVRRNKPPEPPPKPRPPELHELLDPDGTGVQLNRLMQWHCRFPKGDPRDPTFEYCGAIALPDLPYCEHHAALCYSVQPSLSRRSIQPKGSHYGHARTTEED